MNDDNLDWKRIEKRARKMAQFNSPKKIPKDIQPSPSVSKDRRDDSIAILQSTDGKQARDTANLQKNTGNSRSLPAYYHQYFEGKSQAELLEQREWTREQVPSEFSMTEWRNIIREQLAQWASRAMAPDVLDAKSRPAVESSKPIDPSFPTIGTTPVDRERSVPQTSKEKPTVQPTSQPLTDGNQRQQPVPLPSSEHWPPAAARLTPADRELYNTPVSHQIIGDPAVFRRWSRMQAGEHPDTGTPINKELEGRTYKQEKERSDNQAIVSQSRSQYVEDMSEPAPQRRSTAIDMAQLGLDAIGVVDPTGIADGLNMGVSLGRAVFDKERRGEHLKNAAISGVSMIPYVGDLAKTLKVPGAAKTVRNASNLSHAGKSQQRAQYRNTASGVLDSFTGGRNDGGDNDQPFIAGAGGSGGGAGSGSIPPSAGGGFPPGDPSNNGIPTNNPREITDRIEGQRELDKRTSDLSHTFETLTLAVGSGIVAFASLFETGRKLNRVQVENASHLQEVNGSIARAMAMREVATIQRNIREGQTMQDSVVDAASADSRMEASRERLVSPIKAIGTDLTAGGTNVLATVTDFANDLAGASEKLQTITRVVGWFTDKLDEATEGTDAFFRKLLQLPDKIDSANNTATTRLFDDLADGRLDGKSKSGNFFGEKP